MVLSINCFNCACPSYSCNQVNNIYSNCYGYHAGRESGHNQTDASTSNSCGEKKIGIKKTQLQSLASYPGLCYS